MWTTVNSQAREAGDRPARKVLPSLFLAGLLLFALVPWVAGAVVGDDALLDVEALLEAIAASAFEEPIHLESEEGERAVHGQVHAILDVPLAELHLALGNPRGWCEILFLHYNVKSCVHQSLGEAAELSVSIGRKHYQDPGVLTPTRLDFYADRQGDGPLAIRLQADRGPLGVRAFQIQVRAVALDEGRSLMRLSYSLGYGRLAQLAMRVYFATGGRERTGFTTDGLDQAGAPAYVRGIRGMIERNTLRFFYALITYLRMPEPDQVEARHVLWFEHTERHPQLREMDRGSYLAQKRRERRDQEALQEDL